MMLSQRTQAQPLLLPNAIRIGRAPRSRTPTTESRIAMVENKLVYLEPSMDAADATVSENLIEMDNVRH